VQRGLILANYLPIFIFSIIAVLFVAVVIGMGFVLGKSKPSIIKNAAYECGVEAEGNAKQPFPVKFFLIAVLFLLFDVETIFFFPWAISLRTIGWFGFFTMLIFIIILAVGYIFELWMARAVL
jgi:NADH-quinone oxidoreductase subunit A